MSTGGASTEALRMHEHPLIAFKDGPPRLLGTGSLRTAGWGRSARPAGS